MELVSPSMISEIDSYAERVLDIPVVSLMERSGEAVASVVRERIPRGSALLFLCGKGNNGGDGYAAALKLFSDYRVRAIDVFSSGQKSEAGKYFLNEYLKAGGEVLSFSCLSPELLAADAVIDAILGTGATGSLDDSLLSIADAVNSSGKRVIAVDLPLGVNAEDGTASPRAVRAEATVSLSFMKVGLLSYPARELVGEIHSFDLGIPREKIISAFEFKNFLVDRALAESLLPPRGKNTNKGSFGKALLITGSREYEGAGRLSLEAALRGGAGIVGFFSDRYLRDRLIVNYPEAIYYPSMECDGWREELLSVSSRHNAILIGSGSGVSEKLYRAVSLLLSTEGAPMVIDADGINSLARYGSAEELKCARRTVILTPHPLELSRLSAIPVERINAERLRTAKEFAHRYGIILLLKGAATVITDGQTVYINSSGNSALAKGGSGDALAGLLVSLLASRADPLKVTALAAYIHGAAGDALSDVYSELGVTPSDLPREMARQTAILEKKNK